MFEKVNPSHPDKIADRIAGALVDYAYTQSNNPKVAFEVLIGHHCCSIYGESSVDITKEIVKPIVDRIVGNTDEIQQYDINITEQDEILASNQSCKEEMKCGDNGIFKGSPLTLEQCTLTKFVQGLYENYESDGKFIVDFNNFDLYVCQSNMDENSIILSRKVKEYFDEPMNLTVNPLGHWKGGLSVDTGCTNRKLGSDMGDSITGGGLHGKDLSKADVSVNIYIFNLASYMNSTMHAKCAIGSKDVFIENKKVSYSKIVDFARSYIKTVGGFEKFAEYGLINPQFIASK